MPVALLLGLVIVGGAMIWGLSRGTRRPAVSPPTLVVLGDSLAVGLAPYLAAWARQHGLGFVADAKVGRRVPQQNISMVPEGAILFVSLGTNDAVSPIGHRSLPGFVASLKTRSPKKIFWLLPPATRNLPGLASIKNEIRGLGVSVIEIETPMKPDGLHPMSYALAFREMNTSLPAVA